MSGGCDMKLNIIEYITKNTDFRQKDIAERLAVSTAQISKWKSGEYISQEREEALLQLAGLFGDDAEWAMLVKTEENSKSWIEYVRYRNEIVDLPSYTIQDMPEIYVRLILSSLADVGVVLPNSAPSVNQIDKDGYESSLFDSLVGNYLDEYSRLIYWHQANIGSLNFDDAVIDGPHKEVYELEDCAVSLTLCYVDNELLIETGADNVKLKHFQQQSRRKTKDAIVALCEAMRSRKMPFTTDYFDYLSKSPEWLEDEQIITEEGVTSVTDFLTYQERNILEKIDLNNRLLTELQAKVDRLLS